MKFVFTVKEDICAQNEKDPTAKQLLETMQKYGEVKDYETIIAEVRAEDKKTIAGLYTQLEAIKEQKLTPDEIRVVKTYRECVAAKEAEHIAKNECLVKQLQAVKVESEQRIARIRQAIGE